MKRLIIIFLIFYLAFLNQVTLAIENDPVASFIIIHLDGISYDLFIDELEEGNLPNLEKRFVNNGHIIPGLTYFPPLTPVIMSRIKEGISSSTGDIIAWDGYDRHNSIIISRQRIQQITTNSMSRRSLSNSLYGTSYPFALGLDSLKFLDDFLVPITSRLASPALVNTATLLEEYPVMDFYWLATDSYAHIDGRASQIKNLYYFDNYFGKFVKNINLDLNIIIYADHGMRFFEPVNTDYEIIDLIGSNLLKISYPSIFITDNYQTGKYAKELAVSENIEFVFYKSGENKITGFYQGEVFYILNSPDKKLIKYLPLNNDPLGYSALTVSEYLDFDSWVELTINHEFPGLPHSVWLYMQNPTAGDIIYINQVIDADLEIVNVTGDHTTAHRLDMLVPVLISGPELEHLYNKDFIRLDNLINEIPAFNIENIFITPSREKNSFDISASFIDAELKPEFNLKLSPEYRTYFNLGLNYNSSFDKSVEYDLLSGYIGRFWLGAGFNYNDSFNPFLQLRTEFNFNNIRFEYTRLHGPDIRDSHYLLGYRLNSNLYFNIKDFNKIGLSYSW